MSRLSRLPSVLSDYVRVNARYLTSGSFRAAARQSLNAAVPDARAGHDAEERGRSDPRALAYHGLLSTSLSLAGVRVAGSRPVAVNILLGDVRQEAMFAGVDTAIAVGAALARARGLAVRLIVLEFATEPLSPGRSETLSERYGAPITIVPREEVPRLTFSAGDIWMATHFSTAHALQVATETGRIDVARCVYLVQDYEPGFMPWSTEYALAKDTYHAGFLLLVNSEPVAQDLRAVESLDVPSVRVFRPVLDLDRLRTAAESRTGTGQKTVFFYGRRSKPRNMFKLGVAVMRAAVTELGPAAEDLRFASVGEWHRPVRLGGGSVLRSLGKLEWGQYFDFLGTVDVALSLQHSPHPSHPPLEAATAGAIAITNDWAGSRGSLHPRLRAVDPTVPALSRALVAAVREPVVDRSFAAPALDLLGGTVDSALEAAWAELDARS